MMKSSAEAARPSIPLRGDMRGSSAGDAYGKVFAQLRELCGKEGGRISVTSAGRREGKSTTAANLALSIAVAHEPVLLLEMALQRPSLQGVFGESPLPFDVGDVLRGSRTLEQVVCRRNDIDLHLAMLKSAYEKTPDAARIDGLLSAARELYRWVVVDCSSVDDGSSFRLVDGRCEATVLVVDERRTNRKRLAGAWKMCTADRTCVLLNRHASVNV